jgi:uncharacterized protein YqgV (UPF0045/DUF77 family)
MEALMNKRSLFIYPILFALMPTVSHANSVISSFDDSGSVVKFAAGAKSGQRPSCNIGSGLEDTWAIEKSNASLYNILLIAKKSNLVIEVESANTCIEGNIEQAANIQINYTESQNTNISKDLNFVSRAMVTTVENATIDSVTFTLKTPDGANH